MVKTLLIDGNNLFKIGFHGVRDFYHEGKHIGGIYHFVNTIKKFLNEHNHDKVIVFWDGENNSSQRKLISPDYKGNRRQTLNEAKKEAQRLNRARTQEQITKFYEGSINYLSNIPHALLRLSKEGNTIETSRGANVPLNEAKILYHRINTGKDIKGFKIGHYTTKGIKDDIIKIGCHDIRLDEVNKLKNVLI